MFGLDSKHSSYIEKDDLPANPGLQWKVTTQDEVWSSPLIYNSKAFIGSTDGTIYVVEVRTGETVWEYDTGSEIYSSPAVAMEHLYVCDMAGNIYSFALDPAGIPGPDPEWVLRTQDGIRSSPTYSNGKVLVGSLDNNLYAIEHSSGEIIWSFEAKAPLVASPAIDDDLVLVGDYSGYMYAIDEWSGSLVWENYIGGAIFSSPAISDGITYVLSNELFAIETASGEVRWTGDLSNRMEDMGGWGESTPALSSELVVVGSDSHSISAFDKVRGDKVWTLRIDSPICSSPLILGDRVFFGSDDHRLYSVDLEDGNILWSYETQGDIDSSPTSDGNVVIVGSRDGNLYCFGKATKPEAKDLAATLRTYIPRPQSPLDFLVLLFLSILLMKGKNIYHRIKGGRKLVRS